LTARKVFFLALEKCLKNINAHGGFTPAAWLPPDEITPDNVIQHDRAVQGRSGGTGTVPSFIFFALNLYPDKNEFYRAFFFIIL
jgi:hypothetical protein